MGEIDLKFFSMMDKRNELIAFLNKCDTRVTKKVSRYTHLFAKRLVFSIADVQHLYEINQKK